MPRRYSVKVTGRYFLDKTSRSVLRTVAEDQLHQEPPRKLGVRDLDM